MAAAIARAPRSTDVRLAKEPFSLPKGVRAPPRMIGFDTSSSWMVAVRHNYRPSSASIRRRDRSRAAFQIARRNRHRTGLRFDQGASERIDTAQMTAYNFRGQYFDVLSNPERSRSPVVNDRVR